MTSRVSTRARAMASSETPMRDKAGNAGKAGNRSDHGGNDSSRRTDRKKESF